MTEKCTHCGLDVDPKSLWAPIDWSAIAQLKDAIRTGKYWESKACELSKLVEQDRSYLISCPWCGYKMDKQPIVMQMNHLISCGDKRIGELTYDHTRRSTRQTPA